MPHPNENRLRDLYAIFAQGDLEGFLAGCTEDATFTVPGDSQVSGQYTKAQFPGWIGGVLTLAAGTFREDVLDIFANDDHGVLLLEHFFRRDGADRQYRTAHICGLRGGLIASWTEHPGSMAEFEEAWGRR